MNGTTDRYAGKRVVVTGGLGFIGSNLAIRLVELGADVLVIDAMLPAYGGTLENVAPVRERLRVDTTDLRDGEKLGPLLADREVIFSLAGQISHIESMQDPATDLAINCSSQLSLLEACRATGLRPRIVYASTRQIYGRPRYLPVDEAHPLDPVDVNGIHKLAAETYHRVYHTAHAFPTVSLRLTNTYGPRMEIGNDKKGLAGIFLRKALLGEPISLFGGGHQKRDFNHVDDVVEALLRAGTCTGIEGEVYNLGHPEPTSLRRFTEILSRHAEFETRDVPFPDDAARIDIGDYYGDYSRFGEATGWSPRIGLEAGLPETLAWYRDAGWRPPA